MARLKWHTEISSEEMAKLSEGELLARYQELVEVASAAEREAERYKMAYLIRRMDHA